MENETSKAVPAVKKGFAGIGVMAVVAKSAALLFGHHASAAVHVAEEAAPALIHAAPAVTHDVASVAAHSNLIEDASKTVGHAMTSSNTMSDAERIAQNAANVAKGYARQKAREARRDERKDDKTP